MFASKKYDQNIELAQRAISYARRTVPYGSSNRNDILTSKQHKRILKRLKAFYFSTPAHSLAFFIPLAQSNNPPTQKQLALINTFVNSDEKIKCENFRSKITEIGNCDLQTFLTFEWLRNQGVRPIEKFCMEGGGHTFVVIGRDPTTDPRDPHSWNSDAIICDPWVDECYSAKEFIYATEGVFKKESLQTKGFIRLEEGIYEGDYLIRKFSREAWNTVNYFQSVLPNLIGSFQKNLKDQLTQKDFQLLEELKDNLLRINLAKIAPDFKNVFDNFLLKANNSGNFLEFHLLTCYLTRLVSSKEYVNFYNYYSPNFLEDEIIKLNKQSIAFHFIDKIKDYYQQIQDGYLLASLTERLYHKLIQFGYENDLSLIQAEIIKYSEEKKDNPMVTSVTAELLNEVNVITAIVDKANKNKEIKAQSANLFFKPNSTEASSSNDPISNVNETFIKKNVRND